MQATQTTRPPSEKQVAFIRRLQAERGIEPTDGPETAREASRYIDRLLATPKVSSEPEAERREAPDALQPGVYEVDGVVYIVKPTKAEYKDQPLSERRLYAKRVVELNSTRIVETEDGEKSFVEVDFVYDRGAVFRIHPEHRMTGDRAKELTIRYGRCIVCGAFLKAGESVEQGIGPVCVKNFPDLVEERKAIKSRARAEAKETTPSLLDLAKAIEGSDEKDGTEVGEEPEFVADEPTDRRPIDAEARTAREFIVRAIDAYEFEAGPMDEERERALATFDRLVAGFER